METFWRSRLSPRTTVSHTRIGNALGRGRRSPSPAIWGSHCQPAWEPQFDSLSTPIFTANLSR
jgi:hypothetical protein